MDGGYGGHYLDGDGNLVFWVKEPSLAPGAEGLLTLFRESEAGRPIRFRGTAEVRKADFDFDELRSWRDSLFGRVFGIKGVHSLDLDERMNRVVIGVLEEDLPAFRAMSKILLAELGIPEGAVVATGLGPSAGSEHSGPARSLATLSVDLTSNFNPVPAGVEYGYHVTPTSISGCTIGLITTDRKYSNPVMVGPTHCSYKWAGLDPAYSFSQALGGGTIGYEVEDYPSWKCTTDPSQDCIYADAMLVEMTHRPGEVLEIARPLPGGSLTIDPNNPRFHIVGGVPQSLSGMPVVAVGKTSGMDEGTILRTCVHTLYNNRVVLCMDSAVGIIFTGGDSGAPVFQVLDWSTSEVLMLGVYRGHFGFLGIEDRFSPMGQIYLAYPQLAKLVE